MYFFFFFSSRRRHTRLQGDWSSDVCSSDLCTARIGSVLLDHWCIIPRGHSNRRAPTWYYLAQIMNRTRLFLLFGMLFVACTALIGRLGQNRSEERRVGEEGRSRGGPYH